MRAPKYHPGSKTIDRKAVISDAVYPSKSLQPKLVASIKVLRYGFLTSILDLHDITLDQSKHTSYLPAHKKDEDTH